jgi:predicted ATPase/DNA-binding SARP family transcriptional activator
MQRPSAPKIERRSVLEARLLGGCALRYEGRPLPDTAFRRRRTFTLLLYLLSVPDQRAPREQILELLWPEKDPEESERGLRVVLSDLRAALGGSATRDVVVGRGPLIGLQEIDLSIDAVTFETAAVEALAQAHPEALRRAAAGYTGPYLPGRTDDHWVSVRREHLRRLQDKVLTRLVDLEEDTDPTSAEHRLRGLLLADPTAEPTARRLMELLAGQGRPEDALRVFDALAEALRDELGLLPMPGTEALRRLLLQDEPVRTGSTNPMPSSELRLRPINLPASFTSFVGREWELAEIKGLLLQPLSGCRLLTLTGSGGCGKTRLALEAAAAMPTRFPDGVRLVELASLTDPELAPQALAAVLGVQEQAQGGQTITELVLQALRPQRALLVLDNCEHLLGAVADLAATIMSACPAVHLLATSRQALGIVGEVTWLVPSLSLPPTDDPHTERVVAPTELLRFGAVRLFVERAQAAKPGFALTEAAAAAVAQVCRRLDGIPLAIELAAAQVRALSIGDLAARLDDRFHLLGTGNRAALPRHRTLRAAIDWSYTLLEEAERLVLQRLSVFAGGCPGEAAEAVCSGEEIRHRRVLPLLDSLTAKSLVQREELRDDQDTLRVRYSMLETLRQYARDQLEAAPHPKIDVVRTRHQRWYTALAEQAEPELSGPRQPTWLNRLDLEHDNMRAALNWARTSGGFQDGLRLAGSLWRYWVTRGYFSEGRAWLEELAAQSARSGESLDPAVGIKALNGAGALAYYQADYAQALIHYEAGLTMVRASGDKKKMPGLLNNLGLVRKDQGDYAAAMAFYEESLVLYRELGDKRGTSKALNNLGIAAGDQGDSVRAAAFHEESLRIKRELGDRHGMVTSLNNLGVVLTDLGDYERARALHEEGLALAREIGHKWSIHIALSSLGRLAKAEGDYSRAVASYQESLELCRTAGNDLYTAVCLAGLSAVLQVQGRVDQATRLSGAASGLCERTSAPLPADDQKLHDRTIAMCRAALGESFAALWAAGRALSHEAAIAEALHLDAEAALAGSTSIENRQIGHRPRARP